MALRTRVTKGRSPGSPYSMEDTCSLEKLSKFLCFFLSFIISGKLKFTLDLLIHQKLGIVLETLNQKLRCDVFCFERPFIRTGDYLL